jgi:quercetin dioxygenase-like cupin family protein
MLKSFPFFIVLVLMGLMIAGTMDATAQKKMDKVTWSADDIKWVPEPAAPPGVMTALLWGDPNGAHGGFTKFPAGFKAPLHYHTYSTKIIVIKGGYTYNGKTYGPGSYLFIPGGDKHESGGVEGSETIFLLEQPGKFDVKIINPPGTKK